MPDHYSLAVRRTLSRRMAIKKEVGFKARRWVVEWVHSWMNRFRRFLVRWDKKPTNYLAFLHFACGLIAFRGGYSLKTEGALLIKFSPFSQKYPQF